MKKSFKESAEEVISELIDELLEEQEKLEENHDKIMNIGIIEKITMEEIKSEILNKIKIFEVINTETKKFNSKLMKKMFWNEADETLERLRRKMETKKLKN